MYNIFSDYSYDFLEVFRAKMSFFIFCGDGRLLLHLSCLSFFNVLHKAFRNILAVTKGWLCSERNRAVQISSLI